MDKSLLHPFLIMQDGKTTSQLRTPDLPRVADQGADIRKTTLAVFVVNHVRYFTCRWGFDVREFAILHCSFIFPKEATSRDSYD